MTDGSALGVAPRRRVMLRDVMSRMIVGTDKLYLLRIPLPFFNVQTHHRHNQDLSYAFNRCFCVTDNHNVLHALVLLRPGHYFLAAR